MRSLFFDPIFFIDISLKFIDIFLKTAKFSISINFLSLFF